MAIEILTGSDIPSLLARAQQLIGEDAVVLGVRRILNGGKSAFEMVAADPATAESQRRRETKPAPGADVILQQELERTRGDVRPSSRARGAAGADSPDAGAAFWDLSRSPRHDPAPAAPVPAAARDMSLFHWPFPLARKDALAPAARRPLVVALVGPTGAGKTTTMAKLANHPQAYGGRRVGMLGLDTYRIGGVEQARQYAELSRLPFEVAWDSHDIARALKRLKDCDVILVDTPGRGPRAAADLQEAQARLLELRPDEVHLVLPAGLQRALARDILTAHLPFGVTHLLPTKLDEYPDERSIFEVAAQFALPMRWIADGQEVPRDLQPAPEGGRRSPRPARAAEAV